MVRVSNGRSRSRGGKGRARGARAEAKFLARRREILRAAAVAFRKHGLQQTGMREIAEEAGLSPANLYYYFDGKHELLSFCQEHALERMLAACAEASAADDPPAEKLRRVIEAQLGCMLDELDGAAAHVAVDALPADLREGIVRKRDRYERALRALIEEGVEEGAFAPCDSTLVTRAILGALNWTAQWYRPGGGRSSASVAEEFARYLVRGVLQ